MICYGATACRLTRAASGSLSVRPAAACGRRKTAANPGQCPRLDCRRSPSCASRRRELERELSKKKYPTGNHSGPKENAMQLNPYLSFDGRCEEAFKFYEQCLGGKIVAMMTFGGSP